MKKSLLALALLGAFAGVAQAETAVTIYGTLDAGVAKRNDTTLTVGKRDNNKLGFKGTEDLGSGLKALFQLEIRYEPDTGTLESTTRPLFQGQSRVGLEGSFGMIRMGRGLTAYQESSTAFEPLSGIPGVAGFQTDIMVAGYTSDPLSGPGNSGNRFGNAFFYNSPEVQGMQLNATMATKENNAGPAIIGRGTAALPQYAANAEASANPYSLSATYKANGVGFMAAFERNAIETKLYSFAGSVMAMDNLKLMASYTRQDMSHTKAINSVVKAWNAGLNYMDGASKYIVAYGQKTPEGLAKTKQFSLGYEYNLSKRTYLYVDASNKKGETPARAVDAATQAAKAAVDYRFYSMGIHHNF